MQQLPLLRHIAAFGKPIILSTGMNDIPSIAKAVQIFEERQVPYALLHTTNLYPTPPELVRLGALQQLQAAFPNVITGLSDHTTSNHACFAAVALVPRSSNDTSPTAWIAPARYRQFDGRTHYERAH